MPSALLASDCGSESEIGDTHARKCRPVRTSWRVATMSSMDIGHAPTPSRPSHATASPAEIAAVNALIRRAGLTRAQRTLGLDRHTLDRVRGGLAVHRGTMMCVRAGLAADREPQP